MAYKYISASSTMVTPPKQTYIDNFAQRLFEGFENSSDWFTIQEESPFGTETYVDVDARINYVISNETGEKMSDDYKLLWFKDLDHKVKLGTMFFFDDNYWLCINTERVKSLTTSVTVKRCNNSLRWMGEDGGLYRVPCTQADTLIRENRDYSTTGSAVVNVAGVLEIIAQFNAKTNKIKANQRFLFGNPSNWYSYKIFGGGVNNINLMNTNDFMSAGLVRYTMTAWQENPDSDDLVNGYCDVHQETYVVSLAQVNPKLNSGQSLALDATVTLNGKSVTRNFTWVSSDPSICTVSSTGIITGIQSGLAKIYCYLQNNSSVYATVDVTVDVAPTDNKVVLYEPPINYLLQGTNQTFDVFVERNGVRQPDTFTFTVISAIPATKYTFTVVDGNHFKVENLKMYLTSPLIIRCVSGTYTKDISILLKGGW